MFDEAKANAAVGTMEVSLSANHNRSIKLRGRYPVISHTNPGMKDTSEDGEFAI